MGVKGLEVDFNCIQASNILILVINLTLNILKPKAKGIIVIGFAFIYELYWINMRPIILFTLLLILIPESFSCTCEKWGGPFLKVAPESDIIVIAEIKKYKEFTIRKLKRKPIAMEVEILELLNGIEKRNVITVWGFDYILASCQPHICDFEKGSKWILALNRDEDGSWRNEKVNINDYNFSICAEYSLKLENDKVKGIIESNIQYLEDSAGNWVLNFEEMDLDDFKTKLKNRITQHKNGFSYVSKGFHDI